MAEQNFNFNLKDQFKGGFKFNCTSYKELQESFYNIVKDIKDDKDLDKEEKKMYLDIVERAFRVSAKGFGKSKFMINLAIVIVCIAVGVGVGFALYNEFK